MIFLFLALVISIPVHFLGHLILVFLPFYFYKKFQIKLNLNLRCASQILFSVKEFVAFNADELYKTLVDFEWENVIALDGYFSITSNVNNETITNNLFG